MQDDKRGDVFLARNVEAPIGTTLRVMVTGAVARPVNRALLSVATPMATDNPGAGTAPVTRVSAIRWP